MNTNMEWMLAAVTSLACAAYTVADFRRRPKAQQAMMLDLVCRGLAAIGMCVFVYRVAVSYQRQPSLALLLMLIGELLTLALVLTAKRADSRDWHWKSVLPTVAGTFYFLLVSFDATPNAIAPAVLTDTLQIIAIIWQIAAKIALGRAFGLLPANRGLVTSGLYRWLRNPIYAGYVANWAGFILAYASLYNLGVLVGLVILLVIRIQREELTLASNKAYAQYREQTRFRLVPGMW